MKQIHPAQFPILAVHPGALGDLILFGEFLSALRRRHGRARLIAGAEKGALLAGLGVVEEALDFESLPMAEVFADTPVSECSLPKRLGGCDLLVSCLAAGDEAAQQRLAALCSAGRAVFLPIRPPEDFDGHLVDLWAGLAGVESVPLPDWRVPEAWRAEARAALAEAGAAADGPYVLIHPGSGSREKCWPLDRFVELARSCAPAPVFVLGPTELDWWGAATAASLRAEFPTLVAPPLAVLAALAAGASACVGNDSGPTHLAAAVGTPTVAIFGTGARAHFAPRGPRVQILADADVASIAPDAVLAALGGAGPLAAAGG